MRFLALSTDTKHTAAMARLVAGLRAAGHEAVAKGADKDFILVDNAGSIRSASVPIIWLPHGLSPSKWAFCNQRFDWHLNQNKADNLADLMLLPGPWWLTFMRQYFPTSRQAFVTGWPKADALVDANVPPAKAGAKPVILFAPSWNRADLSTVGTFHLVDDVQKIASQHGTFVVVPHHPDFHKRDGAVEVGDITPWLKAADVLITDQSSTAIEFAVLDKPVLHLTDVIKARQWSGGDGQQFAVGALVTLDDLGQAITEALAAPNKYKHLRDYWVAAMLYDVGHATQRCIRVIEAFMGIWKDTNVHCHGK